VSVLLGGQVECVGVTKDEEVKTQEIEVCDTGLYLGTVTVLSYTNLFCNFCIVFVT
jgi:hypothetical protein